MGCAFEINGDQKKFFLVSGNPPLSPRAGNITWLSILQIISKFGIKYVNIFVISDGFLCVCACLNVLAGFKTAISNPNNIHSL